MHRPATLRVLTLVLGLVVGTFPAAVSAQGDGGNAAAAHGCRNGGWQQLARTEAPTVPFANQGECVSYAARGGVLTQRAAPAMSIQITGGTTAPDGVIMGTGFPSGGEVTGVGLRNYLPELESWFVEGFGVAPTIQIDSSGTFRVEGVLFCFADDIDNDGNVITQLITDVEVQIIYTDPDAIGDQHSPPRTFLGYCTDRLDT